MARAETQRTPADSAALQAGSLTPAPPSSLSAAVLGSSPWSSRVVSRSCGRGGCAARSFHAHSRNSPEPRNQMEGVSVVPAIFAHVSAARSRSFRWVWGTARAPGSPSAMSCECEIMERSCPEMSGCPQVRDS